MKVMMTMALVAMVTVACNAQPGANVKLESKKDTSSYAIGMSIGSSMKKQELDVDPDKIAAGLRQALLGEATLLTEEQMAQVLQSFQEEMMAKQQELTAKKGEEAMKKGEAFLAKNKTQAGVMTTPSGLQYKVIKEGKGAKPTATSQVKVHYTGTLIDGKKFDSSVDRGEPAVFGLNQVIPAWTEGLQLMSVGSKYMLYIPSAMGYGPTGNPPVIGPNEVLIFEVELIEIVK
jgi:FKBP-type peptidyl-prolyl cis-trans isomerase